MKQIADWQLAVLPKPGSNVTRVVVDISLPMVKPNGFSVPSTASKGIDPPG